MGKTYRQVVATARGRPEVMQVVETELREPGPGEVRVRILAVAVCQDDVAVRQGKRPFLASIPFVPGYSFIGEVDALGVDVDDFARGERVAALVNYGAYAEYFHIAHKKLVKMPRTLDPAPASTLILNNLTAYQVMHREAQVKAGESALIVGASGGVGSALLQLGKEMGLKMYGLASKSKHHLLTEWGATPIDYRNQDFVEVLRRAEPQGLDYVFNGMAEDYMAPGMQVLRRGGTFVHYGGPESKRGLLLVILRLLFYSLLPNGKALKGYGTHRAGLNSMKEDWAELFRLLETGSLRPAIADVIPLLEAARANERLESGEVVGNLVLVSPELMGGG